MEDPMRAVLSDLASRNCDEPDECGTASGTCLPCRARHAIDTMRTFQPFELQARIKRLFDALAGFAGVSSLEDLEQLELGVRVLPAAQEDKINALNAVHALREEMKLQEAADEGD